MLTYVYALVRAPRRPPLRAMPSPVPEGDPVRIVAAADSLWLAVSTVPPQAYDQAALETGLRDLDRVGPRAVAHEAVVEHFLSCAALLPMQLFTLFTSDERAVAHVLRTRPRIERILGRVQNRVEWGLRLTWDEEAARVAAEREAAAAAVPASGAAYLARRRDLLAARRDGCSTARAAADGLFRTLSHEAAGARRHATTEAAAPGSRVLLDAAFLVPAQQTTAFRRLLWQQAQGLEGQGIAVSLTGPWPPWNFV